MNKYLLHIKKIKNNCFLSISRNDGKLLIYTTLKRKNVKDMKNKILWGLMYLFKKLKASKIKIHFIILSLSNTSPILVQQIFIILKTWNIRILAFNYTLAVPHNGCRKAHMSRKRNKKRKKNKEQIKGL